MVFRVDSLNVCPGAVLVPCRIAEGIRVRNVIGFLFQALQLPIRTGIVRRDT
jgi:hypothetical protein